MKLPLLLFRAACADPPPHNFVPARNPCLPLRWLGTQHVASGRFLYCHFKCSTAADGQGEGRPLETQGPTPLVPMQGSTDRAGGTASASGLRLPGESKTHIAPPDATYTRLRP